MRFVLTVLAGMVIGALLSAVYQCMSAWYHGGSPDPRCVYGMEGYVEIHKLDDPKRGDRVSCEYRPDIKP
jgi:hypothetical protein